MSNFYFDYSVLFVESRDLYQEETNLGCSEEERGKERSKTEAFFTVSYWTFLQGK